MAECWLDTPYNLQGKKIWIAGHNGMVGASFLRRLALEECEILTIDRSDLDLRRQSDVEDWMAQTKPNAVVVCAAKVGGIYVNNQNPAPFFYDNMMMSTNIIHASYLCDVERLLFLGSSCIYPKDAKQPITENALLTGALEPTNEAYALAKISGVKMVEYYRKQYGCDFMSAMPCNLYGVGDRFDEMNSHVIPALIMKAHRAKEQGDEYLDVWGSGEPLREILYVDDLADALMLLLRRYNGDTHVNIGSQEEVSIKSLAHIICDVVEYKGKIRLDPSKPDGVFRKKLDSNILFDIGWKPKICPKEGIQMAYSHFINI